MVRARSARLLWRQIPCDRSCSAPTDRRNLGRSHAEPGLILQKQGLPNVVLQLGVSKHQRRAVIWYRAQDIEYMVYGNLELGILYGSFQKSGGPNTDLKTRRPLVLPPLPPNKKTQEDRNSDVELRSVFLLSPEDMDPKWSY